MRSLYALIRKDLKGYFDQPTGYILLVIFAGVLAYLFFFVSPFTTNQETSARDLFNLLPWLLVVFVPASTMRLIAEEQRDGTLEILLTQPIRTWIVLLAKFLAGLIFVGIAILATLGIPLAIESAGNLDEGAVVAQYVGSLFLAASFVSVGLFTSSMTRNQIVAFILGLFLITVLMLAGLSVVVDALPDRVSSLLRTLSPVTHFSSIARGVIDLRDVLYFVALVSTFLSAAFLMIRGKSLSHQSPQYRNLQLGVAGLIVFSVLVGWFGNSIGGRLDLTEDKLYTLSPATGEILSQLDDILTVTLFSSKDPPADISVATRDVNDFLDDFAASSRGDVKIVRRYPDPDAAAGVDLQAAELTKGQKAAVEAQRAGIPARAFNVRGQSEIGIKVGYLGLTMTYADRRERIPFIASIEGFEYRIASLANNMIQRERKTVGFLTGHGEKLKDQELRTLTSQLEQQYRVIDLLATEDVPLDLSGVDVLIIPGPTQRISDVEQEALHSYLESGGKAMILIDSVLIDQQQMRAVPNRFSFRDFVLRYGVVVEDDLVFDLRANETLPFPSRLGTVLLPYPYWAHVVTVDARVTGDVETVLLPWASSIGITESQIGRVEVISLLMSGPTASVDHAYGDVGPNSPSLEVTESQLFESDLGVAIAAQTEGTSSDEQAQGAFRLVVVGDSEWLTEALAGGAPQNVGLGLNLIDWLAQEDTLASIRSKVITSRRLDFSSQTHQNIVQYVNIVGVPLTLIVIGLILYIRRRGIGLREYTREK